MLGIRGADVPRLGPAPSRGPHVTPASTPQGLPASHPPLQGPCHTHPMLVLPSGGHAGDLPEAWICPRRLTGLDIFCSSCPFGPPIWITGLFFSISLVVLFLVAAVLGSPADGTDHTRWAESLSCVLFLRTFLMWPLAQLGIAGTFTFAAARICVVFVEILEVPLFLLKNWCIRLKPARSILRFSGPLGRIPRAACGHACSL